jgi:hypothetical protein
LGQPHVHLVVRGVADDGSDLVISRDSISRGLRSRAADLVWAELRSKPGHDAAIRMAADDSASSTCGWTIPASMILPAAVCRSWSAWGSPRLQGRANE